MDYLNILTSNVATDITIPVADNHRLVEAPIPELFALILLERGLYARTVEVSLNLMRLLSRKWEIIPSKKTGLFMSGIIRN